MRAVALIVLCAALTACGAATRPRVEHSVAKPPLTPICAFYSTVLVVAMTAAKPDETKLTVPRLRARWPELVATAKRGGEVQWEPAVEARMRPAYARFLVDIDETGVAAAAGDLPRFVRALHAAGRSLRPVDALSRQSKLVCTMRDGHGGSMSIGPSS